MAHSRSAEKRVRQNKRNRIRNKSVRSALKTQIKKFHAAEAPARDAEYRRAVSAVDKAAKRGIIHPNKAAREKSRLSRAMNGPPRGSM